ncbi:inorganic phosphate transporter [Sporichthya polymorpha]|uniref:inorganic phosphate transporter n=1 Tax=Sporichthya polymorpha TaxID=35751 RepID=UPI0003702CDB|nr:inorganic phosphate transporter [Sporichthya polymorpha]
MEDVTTVCVVLFALGFGYTNGFHDSANAIATSISTRALTPRVALLMAAVMNFIGAFLGTQVASTVGKGIIATPEGQHGLVVVLGALVGAIAWNLITWYFGLPSSSSHALFGGLIGAALAGGIDVKWAGIRDKILIPMVISPVFGFFAAFALMTAILWIFRKGKPNPLNRGFRVAQTVSATAMALGHGIQDVQKTMGVIFLALLTTNHVDADGGIPIWVTVSSAAAISLGTYAGGWRIMRTLGRRIIDLDPPRGFASETVAAGVLYTTAYVYAAPISTTHTITSAVMGAGATKRVSAVRWGVAGNIVLAWVFTIPAAGVVAACSYYLLNPVLG